MGASSPFVLRGMAFADVDAGLRLCRQSHWNQVARDWERFLAAEPGGATVAVDAESGQVIGSVAALRYAAVAEEADSLAWIAMVLVDPAHRGSGIGTALLQRALAQAADATTIGLDATPLGQPLYERLGFRVECVLTRMCRATMNSPEAGSPMRALRQLRELPLPSTVRRATPDDRAAIAGLDARATGLDRRGMLGWLQEGAPELAWVADGADGLEGALLGRQGHTACHLGPVMASSTDVALQLVRACLASHPIRPFFLDVADARPGWRTGVETLGFDAQRSFARMYRGSWRPPGDASLLCASIGPEFG